MVRSHFWWTEGGDRDDNDFIFMFTSCRRLHIWAVSFDRRGETRRREKNSLTFNSFNIW